MFMLYADYRPVTEHLVKRCMLNRKTERDLYAALADLCDAISGSPAADDRTLDKIAESFGGNVADNWGNAREALAEARGEAS